MELGFDWALLQVVIHEFAILAGVGAMVFAAGQVWQMQKIREAESLLKILETSFDVLGANPISMFRQNFQMGQSLMTYEEFVERESTPEVSQVGKIIWYYIYMGVALRQRLLPAEALMRWHAPAIVRTWRSIIPIVQGLRQETNSPGFARHFEYLAGEAAAWLQQNQAAEQQFFAKVHEKSKALMEKTEPSDVAVYGQSKKPN